MKENWHSIVLISLAVSIFVPLLFMLFIGESNVVLYLEFFVIMLIIVFLGIGIVVAVRAFFEDKMEVSEEGKDYSLDSGEESGMRQHGSEEED